MKRLTMSYGIILLMSFIVIMNLSGCGRSYLRGFVESKKSEVEWKASADNKVGADAYRRVSACGDYHFNPQDKRFCDGIRYAGRWIKTDEKVYGEEYPNRYDVRRYDMEDSYLPGEKMKINLTFRLENKDIKNSDDIWGSLYFASAISNDISRQDGFVVRKYFGKSQNDDVKDPVEMSRFGRDNDGLQGSSKGQNGDLEYYFDARSRFPRLAADGDTIYVVLDIMDRENTVITRYIREYTFEMTEPEPVEDETDDFNYEDYYPEYYSIEYPGHWDMTDICFIGGDSSETEDGDIRIKAERYGVEGEDMVYTYYGDDGRVCRIYVPDIYPDTRIYADDTYNVWIRNSLCSEPANMGGVLHCSLALADVDFDRGTYGIKVHPRMYFDRGYSEEKETFDAPGKIHLDGSFPAGDESGEKLYLVYGVMDGLSGKVRMYNVYEYTYTKGPDTVWIYNPPMY